MSRLFVHQAGPGLSVQDGGRAGYLAFGLSRGGAADRLAMAEGAALLNQDSRLAALEMAGAGGTFEVSRDTRIALTGAPMQAGIDGAALAWNASHLLPAGARLRLGGATHGVYGYLHIGGGIDVARRLGARSAHLAAGLGRRIESGDDLPLGPDADMGGIGLKLPDDPRFDGGEVRMLAGFQTGFFAAAEIARFEVTSFGRDARGNRMGVRMVSDGPGFASAAGLSVLSEVIVPGDIQITGDGTPFVLLAECQTTGGYPRIGSVLPCDLPRVAQAAPGARIRFRFVAPDEGLRIERAAAKAQGRLRASATPLRRDPHDIRDLLSYQLVGGVTAGNEEKG
ncbi:biotin-dependent carboxyltransferase family protein [Roseovarius sp. D22-M7]|uniref:5-oxoprolinase subunit C family protein n=1 Tax=Roseovarius sp. D22-M7 TaxID=3127116 RepID=UPI00300FEE04